jgi:hypothetical protein
MSGLGIWQNKPPRQGNNGQTGRYQAQNAYIPAMGRFNNPADQSWAYQHAKPLNLKYPSDKDRQILRIIICAADKIEKNRRRPA